MMEFLNGGDLMYHIQDKGRFELYRATYVRDMVGKGPAWRKGHWLRTHCQSALHAFFPLPRKASLG